MLPYRSLWSNVAYCFEMLPVKPGDHIVSMLPMGHVFGMVYDFLYGFSAGAHIYFLTRMPSPKIISQSFSEIKPKVISCVPLIVEKIIKKDILPKVDSKIGKLLLKVPIVNDKIKSLARQAAMEIFGGNFDEIIIGGAPFNAEVEAFLKKIGFPYTIAYGMTECGPIICSRQFYDAGCRNLQLDDCTWGAIVGNAAKQRYQSLGIDLEDARKSRWNVDLNQISAYIRHLRICIP